MTTKRKCGYCDKPGVSNGHEMIDCADYFALRAEVAATERDEAREQVRPIKEWWDGYRQNAPHVWIDALAEVMIPVKLLLALTESEGGHNEQ